MAIATTKPSFKAPSQLMDGKDAGGIVSAVPLLGTWINIDKLTRDLVKIVIAPAPSGITVHAFGACYPTPCDWGAVASLNYANDVGSSLAAAFSAHYSFTFSKIILVGDLVNHLLKVQCFTHFVDGSSRSDYYSSMHMKKQHST